MAPPCHLPSQTDPFPTKPSSQTHVYLVVWLQLALRSHLAISQRSKKLVVKFSYPGKSTNNIWLIERKGESAERITWYNGCPRIRKGPLDFVLTNRFKIKIKLVHSCKAKHIRIASVTTSSIAHSGWGVLKDEVARDWRFEFCSASK